MASAPRRSMAALAIAAGLLACPAVATAITPAPVPYSSHAQVYACCTASAVKDASFREAKESGAAYIRVDIDMNGVFDSAGHRDWRGTDEVAALSRKYQLPVLAVVLGSARPQAGCAPWRGDRARVCPPADIGEWSEQVGQIAARYADTIDHFEIWNEPDGTWAFEGAPEDYARMLVSANREIKAAAPADAVVLGGTMSQDPRGNAWLDRVFRTPGYDAVHAFDLGSIHLRGSLADMEGALAERARFLRNWGRDVPIWVTEHGYPRDSRWQVVPGLQGGDDSQAAYLAATLPALAGHGAQQVFVTLRDNGADAFASEGIVRGAGTPDSPYARAPGWWAVRNAVARWPYLGFRPEYLTGRLRVGAVSPRARVAGLEPRAATRRGTLFRVAVRGRFRGLDCSGKVLITFRLSRTRAVSRRVTLPAGCAYERRLGVRLPIAPRRRATIVVTQRFLGNAATGAGDGPPLTASVRAPRWALRPAPRSTPRVETIHPGLQPH